MKEETYIVKLTRPPGVSVTYMKTYIKDAIGTFGGGFRPPGAFGDDDPGDPFFGGVKCEVKRQGALQCTE